MGNIYWQEFARVYYWIETKAWVELKGHMPTQAQNVPKARDIENFSFFLA